MFSFLLPRYSGSYNIILVKNFVRAFKIKCDEKTGEWKSGEDGVWHKFANWGAAESELLRTECAGLSVIENGQREQIRDLAKLIKIN